MNEQVRAWVDLLARLLLAHMFIYAGFQKILGYAGTQAYMEAHGVWPLLLPLVIIVELIGGLMILGGLYTRVVAFLLAGFSILTALFFHTNWAEQGQMFNFMKNFTIAGGMLVLMAHGPGRISLDHRRSGDRAG